MSAIKSFLTAIHNIANPSNQYLHPEYIVRWLVARVMASEGEDDGSVGQGPVSGNRLVQAGNWSAIPAARGQYACLCVSVSLCRCVCVCMCVYVYVCVFVCLYVCVCGLHQNRYHFLTVF